MEYLKVSFSVKSINALFVWLCPRLTALDGSNLVPILTESGHVRAIRNLTGQMGELIPGRGIVGDGGDEVPKVSEHTDSREEASCLARLNGRSSCSHSGPCGKDCT